jgi:NADPH-dependent F420 reductase
MDIAIIGTGNVGSALGSGWAKGGHNVIFGSRNPAGKGAGALLAETPGSRMALPIEAAAAASIVVLATPFRKTLEIVRSLGDLTNKIVLDATNPIRESPIAESGARAVEAAAPTARVVKVFNATGADNIRNPLYGNEPIDMFVCSDDAEARGIGSMLAEELGFRAVDCGGLDAAAMLEHLAKLWVRLAHQLGHGPDVAFRLVER